MRNNARDPPHKYLAHEHLHSSIHLRRSIHPRLVSFALNIAIYSLSVCPWGSYSALTAHPYLGSACNRDSKSISRSSRWTKPSTVLATFKTFLFSIHLACSYFGPIHGDMVPPSHPGLKRAATFLYSSQMEIFMQLVSYLI